MTPTPISADIPNPERVATAVARLAALGAEDSEHAERLRILQDDVTLSELCAACPTEEDLIQTLGPNGLFVCVREVEREGFDHTKAPELLRLARACDAWAQKAGSESMRGCELMILRCTAKATKRAGKNRRAAFGILDEMWGRLDEKGRTRMVLFVAAGEGYSWLNTNMTFITAHPQNAEALCTHLIRHHRHRAVAVDLLCAAVDGCRVEFLSAAKDNFFLTTVAHFGKSKATRSIKPAVLERVVSRLEANGGQLTALGRLMAGDVIAPNQIERLVRAGARANTPDDPAWRTVVEALNRRALHALCAYVPGQALAHMLEGKLRTRSNIPDNRVVSILEHVPVGVRQEMWPLLGTFGPQGPMHGDMRELGPTVMAMRDQDMINAAVDQTSLLARKSRMM